MSELTPAEQVTARALELIRDGRVQEIPFWLQVAFAKVAARNPDLVAETRARIRSVIEKTTN